jgi:thiamine-phosphate pyrophosphorylase
MPRALDLRLIVITDRGMAAPRELYTIIRRSLQAGAPAVQLRDKHATARDLLTQADELRALTHEFSALFFVNDRLDVALACGADGVHLGPDDIPIAAARAAAPPGFLIGASTDDPAAARAAIRAGADYVGCGAVFGTTSKVEAAGEAIGTHRLQQVVAAVDAPVIAIGGINPNNVGAVVAAGAAGVAVISAIMKSTQVEATVQSLLKPWPRR